MSTLTRLPQSRLVHFWDFSSLHPSGEAQALSLGGERKCTLICAKYSNNFQKSVHAQTQSFGNHKLCDVTAKNSYMRDQVLSSWLPPLHKDWLMQPLTHAGMDLTCQMHSVKQSQGWGRGVRGREGGREQRGERERENVGIHLRWWFIMFLSTGTQFDLSTVWLLFRPSLCVCWLCAHVCVREVSRCQLLAPCCPSLSRFSDVWCDRTHSRPPLLLPPPLQLLWVPRLCVFRNSSPAESCSDQTSSF